MTNSGFAASSPNKYMKTMLKISVLTCLLLAASSPCFALWSGGQVSKEQAKELGMEIRSKANGTNAVWVELEFKPEGKLKSFSHVELLIREGEKSLVTATLREDRPRPGRVVVSFTADRAHLDKITLWVYVADMMPGGTIYELRVKDFVELAPRRDDYPDDISQQVFDTYIAGRGKINSSTYGAAVHIVAERGRTSGFWKSVLKELQKGEERTEAACVHVLGKMLAVDARARDVIRREKETGEIGQWKPSVCLGTEVVQELVRRGQRTERVGVDQYAIALARARVAEATEFFRMILRDEIGKGQDSAKFHAAVGLAQLGEADGFVWLIAHSDNIQGHVGDAWPSRMTEPKHLAGCCVAALRQLSGEKDLQTRMAWESWWEKVDRKTLPHNHVELDEPDGTAL